MAGQSRLAILITRFLNDELQGGARLSQVTVSTVQGGKWYWCFLTLENPELFQSSVPATPLTALAQGELFGATNSAEFYFAPKEHVCERRPQTQLFESPIGATLSAYARACLTPGNQCSHHLFVR